MKNLVVLELRLDGSFIVTNQLKSVRRECSP